MCLPPPLLHPVPLSTTPTASNTSGDLSCAWSSNLIKLNRKAHFSWLMANLIPSQKTTDFRL